MTASVAHRGDPQTSPPRLNLWGSRLGVTTDVRRLLPILFCVTARSIHLALDVTVDGRQLSGQVCDGVGQPKPFSGWLGLIAALDGLLDTTDRDRRQNHAPEPRRHQEWQARATSPRRRCRRSVQVITSSSVAPARPRTTVDALERLDKPPAGVVLRALSDRAGRIIGHALSAPLLLRRQGHQNAHAAAPEYLPSRSWTRRPAEAAAACPWTWPSSRCAAGRGRNVQPRYLGRRHARPRAGRCDRRGQPGDAAYARRQRSCSTGSTGSSPSTGRLASTSTSRRMACRGPDRRVRGAADRRRLDAAGWRRARREPDAGAP